MDSWPPSLKIGAGVAVVAILAIVVLTRLGQHPEQAPPVVPPRQAMPEGEKVQQRLNQLRAAHQEKMMMKAESGGQIGVRPRGATPSTGNARVGAQPPAPNPAGGAVQDEGVDSPPFDEDPDDIPALKTVALQDSDPERRLTAVTMLGASDDPQVIPILAQALSDQDEEVRMAALEALSDFTDEPPVEAIESALNDPSPDIRFEALDVLSDIGGERARLAVQKAMNDPDEDVRALAEGILDFDQAYEPTPGEEQNAESGERPDAMR